MSLVLHGRILQGARGGGMDVLGGLYLPAIPHSDRALYLDLFSLPIAG